MADSTPGSRAVRGGRASPAITPLAVSGGPLTFTFGSWFTWTAIGLAYPALGILLVVIARPLAAGEWESVPVLAATHVATLGWATMTAMGAAAQMAPALLGGRIRGERTVPWQYGLFALSVLAMVIGFLRGDLALVATGGLGVNVAAWWFVLLVVLTMAGAGRRRRDIPPHIPAAFAALLLVLAWGIVLAVNLQRGLWPALLIAHRGLVVHLALGLGGWLGLMIVGTFYRMVPLMHGARVASARRGRGVLILGTAAIGCAVAGVAAGIGWASRGTALLSAPALLLFGWEVLYVLSRRRGRAPDLNVTHWYAVVGYSIVLAGAGVAWGCGWVDGTGGDRFGECAVTTFMLGWVTQAIIGQFYKVTPFLMWYHRATVPDVRAIPMRADLYNPRPGRASLWLGNAGVVALVAGIWTGSTAAAELGAFLVAGAAFVLAYMLAYRWIAPVASRQLAFQWRWRVS